MKSLFSVFALLLVSLSVQADSLRFVNGDGSELTELCIAAASGATNLNELATTLGISSFTRGDVICNGLPLNKFMRKYRTVQDEGTVIMSFRKEDESPETELCYAAVTFSADFERIKAGYLSKYRSFDKVLCNNMSLERFVEKYSVQKLTASVQ